MDAKKIFLVAVIAILAIGSAIWFGLDRATQAASVELAALQAQRNEAEAGARNTEDELARTERKLTEVERLLVGSGSVPVAAAKPLPALGSEIELISTNPQLGALKLQSDRWYVRKEYERLYRALGLAPAQIEEFEKSFVEYRQRYLDLYAIGSAQGESRKATEALASAAKDEFEKTQQKLLGAEGFRQLQEYDRSRSVRNSVAGALAGAAAYHDVPITAEQARRLAQAALQASDQAPAATDEALLRAIDWEKFQAQAREILTPAQYEVMRHVYMPSGYRGLRQLHLQNLVTRAVEADAGTTPPR